MRKKFSYNGLKIRYQFKIIEYENHDFLGECQIWYKTKSTQLLPNIVRVNEGRYKTLINRYGNRSDSEISEIVEPLIIQHIDYVNKKNRFK